jgi:Domain of unknown function (DUF4396)
MLDGVMLLWFSLTAAALLFVTIDIRSTPESPVLKWGFVLLTAYTGVFGAFLYVLGCREPLPGLHERYVAVRWRQTLGSTMHCVAGDGVGILAGAVISSVLGLTGLAEVILEYVLGFAFGWTIFQALFMRDMVGGSYGRALTSTFITTPAFWFVMSMGLLVGFVIAYPMNWWLVANHLKHGMMTIRPASAVAGAHDAHLGMGGAANAKPAMSMGGEKATEKTPDKVSPRPPVPVMTVLSFLALAAGIAIAFPPRPL